MGLKTRHFNNDYTIQQSADAMKVLYGELYDLVRESELPVYLEIKEQWT